MVASVIKVVDNLRDLVTYPNQLVELLTGHDPNLDFKARTRNEKFTMGLLEPDGNQSAGIEDLLNGFAFAAPLSHPLYPRMSSEAWELSFAR